VVHHIRVRTPGTDSIKFMCDLPDSEMDKAFFFKLNTQTEIKMRKENVR
jgi:hypothetical protein